MSNNLENKKFANAKCLICFVSLVVSIFVILFATFGIKNVANAASWDVVPIDEVSVFTEDSLEVQPGSQVSLMSSTVPSYAIYTANVITYEIVSGISSATLNGSTLHIKTSADIGVEIVVRSVVDGVISNNTLVFTVVKIPVQSVAILNTETRIEENGVLSIITEVLPDNASYKNVVYTITEGGLYASVGRDGIVRVKDRLPKGNLSIKVKATCVNDSTVYDEKIFDLYVPVREIIVGNANITEVEQRCTYDFSGVINDNVSERNLDYAIDVGTDTAIISQDGILTVSDDAPIGTEITISIKSADLTVTHTVKVVKVCATSIRLDGVFNQDGLEVLESEKIYADDVLYFNVAFPTPFNVSECQKSYIVELFNGDTAVAEIGADGKSIVIKPQDQISIINPEFTVKISSPENPEAVAIYRSFQVYIKVTDIKITSLATYVDEGSSYSIDELLNAEILPINSDVRSAVYSIEGGAQFAYITDNSFLHIARKDDLPNGNCQISIKATAEGCSQSQIYLIYIKAENIDFTIKNLSDPSYPTNPMSTKTVGDTVGIGEKMCIEFTVDEKATIRTPIVKIKTGSNLIADYTYNNGIIIFNVIPNACASLIQFEACIDDLVVELDDIIIYKPVQDIEAITYTESYANGRYLLSRDDYSKNIIKNLNMRSTWTATTSIGELDLANRSAPIIKIPATTKAGTEITFTVYTNDQRYSFSKEFIFYVAQLDETIFKYGVGGNIISFPYGKDSCKVPIKQVDTTNNYKPQLWVGRSTTVNITTSNGLGLSHYDLTAQGTTITMPSNVNGDYSFVPEITINDGIKFDGSPNVYSLKLPRIYAFKPLSGVPKIVDGTVAMTKNNKTLELSFIGTTFDSTATYKITDLNMKGSNLSGAKLIGNKLTITSNSADEYQTIVLTCDQFYNGIELTGNDVYYETVTQRIKRITLNKMGGKTDVGDKDILAIDGMQTSISTPSRTGYKFCGYYTSTGGYGTQYYDGNGKLAINYHSSYSNTTLYASWTPITYTVIAEVYVNDKIDSTQWTDTWIYNHSYTLNAEGDNFLYYMINGDKYTDRQPIVSNLTTTDGDTVYIRAYFENSCVATGTLITLADGTQKAVEELDGTEMLLVWNMLTGSFDSAPILFIDSHGEREYDIIHLYFSDDTDVKVIVEHGFWDFNLNRYVYLSSDNAIEYIGHWFNKQYINELGDLSYKKVQLTDVQFEKEWTNAWSPVTYSHLCYYVNGMLSVPDDTEGLLNYFIVDPDTLMYDQDAMNADIELYGLFDYEADFAGLITEEIFNAFNGQYLKISIGKGLLTVDDLMLLIENYSKFFDENYTEIKNTETQILVEEKNCEI